MKNYFCFVVLIFLIFPLSSFSFLSGKSGEGPLKLCDVENGEGEMHDVNNNEFFCSKSGGTKESITFEGKTYNDLEVDKRTDVYDFDKPIDGKFLNGVIGQGEGDDKKVVRISYQEYGNIILLVKFQSFEAEGFTRIYYKTKFKNSNDDIILEITFGRDFNPDTPFDENKDFYSQESKKNRDANNMPTGGDIPRFRFNFPMTVKVGSLVLKGSRSFGMSQSKLDLMASRPKMELANNINVLDAISESLFKNTDIPLYDNGGKFVVIMKFLNNTFYFYNPDGTPLR